MSVIHHGMKHLWISKLHDITELTKYTALASCVFLVCEITDTLEDEIEYIWGTRWSFGRIIYHLNRIWGPLALTVYLPILFMYDLTEQSCIFFWLFGLYTSVLGMMFVAGVLIARIWAIYRLTRWALIALCAGYIIICTPFVVVLHLQLDSPRQLAYRAMGRISGCPRKPKSSPFLFYLAFFAIQTALFVATIYKPMKTRRTIMNTPLIKSLIRSEMHFYSITAPVLLLTMLGSLFLETSPAVNQSGLLVAVSSSMCTRLIIATRKWHEGSGHPGEHLLAMSILPAALPPTQITVNVERTVDTELRGPVPS